ncbi:carboxy terminal-processing peptidase [Halotalea alkalilenta]|uniref:carboxy terminal-processing peptidase n=1 Tax=Halotalea alkalilenta TaxID=376489 RepID=UPI0004886CF7|nr:carboxy terminal-processing peptidase [Halotalea alkalilenta]
MSPSVIMQRIAAMAVCLLISIPALAEITPTAEDAQASREVAQSIRFGHYEDINFDEAWSRKAFARMLEMMDPQHLYLLSTDIERFGDLRTGFNQAMEQGELERVYAFYGLFQSRLEQRLEWLIAQLEANPTFDYTGNERLAFEGEVNNWVDEFSELDQVWTKRMKNAALTQKLTEPDIDDAEINRRLVNRYRDQLNRVRQTNNEDVLSLFLGAATSSIDPHTEYMSPDQSESFDIQMRLSLEGIGAMLQSEDEYVKVAQLVPGGPAERSGQLHPADRIIAVGQGDSGDMTSVVSMRLDDVVKLIRGPKGSTVRLEVIPARALDVTQTRTVTITRDTVNLEDQAAKSDVIEVQRNGRTERVGVITVPAFYVDFDAWQSGQANYRSTTRDVAALIEKLKAQNVQGIVLDMRGNGGGALQEANSMVGLFIDRGPTVQVRDARGRINLYGDTDRGVAWDGPLTVLINRLSASASEIFAGAIQDYGRGLVLGSQSFGKGTVQTLSDLSHGELRMTRAKFYRISGESTQERGVEPDITFPTLFSDEEIGESALPNALPWDTVRPVNYRRYGNLDAYLPTLRDQHAVRAAQNPNFRYLQREASLLKTLREQNTSVSLNLEQRRREMQAQEAEQLALENSRRQALGLETLASWTETLDDDDTAPQSDSPINQAQLQESAEILLDYAQLTGQLRDTNVASTKAP